MASTSSLVGRTFGSYILQSVLGSGGMATVYRALDHNLQRDVAVKVLAQSVAAQPGFADRFLQEARLIARLRHPNIVQVYNFGEQDGFSYMVMELLSGPTLEQHMADLEAQHQRLDRDEIQSIIEQIASALDTAHRAGIIHRDIKPSNIMRNVYGNWVLTDFGIAKAAAGNGKSQTQTGFVLGTPNYLSPEQARGLSNLTPASDVYALGVVLYEMLSSKPPFDADTPMQVLIDHIQATPPALPRADLSGAVNGVVQRALAKDPAARFANAGELARTLATSWNATAPQQAPVTAPPTDVHNAATQVWQGAPKRPQSPVPQPVPQPRPAQPQQQARPAPVRPVPAPARPATPTQQRAAPAVPPTYQSRQANLFGPFLTILLVLGLIGIGWLVWQNAQNPTTAPRPTSGLPAVPTAEAPTAELPTAEAPTAEAPTAEPATAEPAPAATSVPEPTPEPAPPATPEPTPEPTLDLGGPAIANPIDTLRTLLSEGQTLGQLGDNGPAIVDAFNLFSAAYNEGVRGQAQKSLGDLRDLYVAGRANGDIERDYANQVLTAIQQIADREGYTLGG